MSRVLFAVLIAALAGCATATSEKRAEDPVVETPPAPPPEAPGIDLEALAARELAPLEPKPIAFPEGSLRGAVECAGEPSVTPADGFVSLEIPVGTEAPVVCFVYPEPIDAGATLTNLIGLVAKSGTVQQLRPGEIVAVEASPAIFLEASYLFAAPEGDLAGLLKAAVFPHPSHPLVCMHDEYGYSASFKRLVLGLARSLEGGAPAAPARYEELQILEVNGQPLGFQRLRILPAREGGAVIESVSTRILPRSATELVVEDGAKTSLSDAGGRLVSLATARSRNGEMHVQMELERQKDNLYRYQGTHSGKELSGTFETKDPAGLPSDVLIADLVRDRLLTGKSPELVVEAYEPSANPVAPLEATLRRSEAGPRALVMALGETSMECRADERGFLEASEMRLGAVTVGYHRVFQRGEP